MSLNQARDLRRLPPRPLVDLCDRSTEVFERLFGRVAVLRRVWGLIPYANNVPIPWVFHFDGTSGETQILSHTRLWGIRDRYVLEVHVPALDRRLAIALAICLDAMQSR